MLNADIDAAMTTNTNINPSLYQLITGLDDDHLSYDLDIAGSNCWTEFNWFECRTKDQ